MRIFHFQLIILTTFFSTLIAFPGHSQTNNERNKPRFSDKLVYGGSLGLQFGTLTLIDLSPVVGYRLTERLETGIGFTYKYYRYKDYWYDNTTGQGYDLKSNITGGSIYVRYHFLENVFAHAEFEQLHYRFTDYYNTGAGIQSDKRAANISSVFIGGGYKQRISQGSYFFIMGLWNLTEDSMSPYSNPVLRMGVMIGR
jgi:hypothetical protein